ncbi:response regulator transcription factor [soil metagenome]|jgi:two-component system response regulator NreC|nr:response regulator transcription factor [Gemmatimonadota bacterium]
MSSPPIRILLVDDHAVLRAGLRALLEVEEGMTVVGEAGTGEAGIQMAAGTRPDVVIMDLSMPGMGGLEATRQIIAQNPATRVLVLTMHGEEEHLLPVLDAGGSGYVNKRSADEELIEAIRTVARGEVFLYPSAAKLLLQGFKGKEKGQDEPLQKLTEREREVLGYTVEGYSSTEIGKKLFISPKTVDTYRSRIMEKLGLHHRSELVRFALQQGLLKP